MRLKTLLYVCLFVVLSSFSSAVLFDDLISYWGFDVDNVTQVDALGVNNGTVTSATFTSNGFISGAYDYDGANDIIAFGTSSTLDFPSEYTINVWYNNTGEVNSALISKNGAALNGYMFLTDVVNSVALYVDGGVRSSTGAVIGQNNWTMITGKWNGSHTFMYVNGVEKDVDVFASSPSSSGEEFETARYTVNFMQGGLDELGVWNRSLSAAEITTLFGAGAGCDFSCINPAAFVLNDSLESDVAFTQVGSVNVNSASFSTILSGSFNVTVNGTEQYFAVSVPIQAVSSNTATCQLLINGSGFGSVGSRSNTAGTFGSMYLTTSNFTLDVGGYNVEFQCLRVGSGIYRISGSEIVGHLLVDEFNVSIPHINLVVNNTFNSVGLTLLNSVLFNTSDLVVDGVHNSTIVVNWDAIYGFNATSQLNSMVSIGSTNCSLYPRNGSSGSFGSVGGDCVLNNAGFNNTFNISFFGSGDGNITANIHIKEFITDLLEANEFPLSGINVASSSLVLLANMTVDNSDHAAADLFVKAGVPHSSNSGSTISNFFLSIDNGTRNSSVVSRTSDLNVGVSILQFLFQNVSMTTHSVELWGGCDNSDCSLDGGELVGFIVNSVSELVTSFNVSAFDLYNNASILVFNVTTINGNVFSTSVGSVTVDSNFLFENLTVRSSGFFSTTILNHSVSNRLFVNLSQSNIFFRAIKKFNLSNIPSFAVNDSFVSNRTSSGLAFLPLQVGDNQVISFNGSPNGFFNFTFLVNVSALDNFTFNITNVFDARLNVTAHNFTNGLSMGNLSGNLSFGGVSEDFNFSGIGGLINVSSGLLYELFITSINYTVDHSSNFNDVNVTADLQLANITLFRDKSLFIRFRDIVTGNNLSGVSLFLFGTTNFNFTVNSEAFLFPFPVDNYDLLATLTGFSTFTSTVSIEKGRLVNITAFMNNDTSPVSFIVRDVAGNFIEGASISIARASDGALIGSGNTDIFGAIQFNLNEDIVYNINASASGFIPFFGTLNAFQSTYTITLSSAVANEQFFIGLSYVFLPPVTTQIANFTLVNFSFNISSGGFWNITSCTFSLLNNSLTGAVLASNSSFCSVGGGFSGNLLVNTSNSSLIIARADIVLNGTNNISVFRFYSVGDFFQGEFSLMTVFDDIKAFTQAGFSSVSLFFVTILAIILITISLGSSLNVFGEPEKMLLFVTVLVGMASFLGLLTVGFTPSGFPEAGQWIVFIIMSLLTIASFLASPSWRLS